MKTFLDQVERARCGGHGVTTVSPAVRCFVSVHGESGVFCEVLENTRRSIRDQTAGLPAGRHFLSYSYDLCVQGYRIWKTMKIICKGRKNGCLPTAELAVPSHIPKEFELARPSAGRGFTALQLDRNAQAKVKLFIKNISKNTVNGYDVFIVHDLSPIKNPGETGAWIDVAVGLAINRSRTRHIAATGWRFREPLNRTGRESGILSDSSFPSQSRHR